MVEIEPVATRAQGADTEPIRRHLTTLSHDHLVERLLSLAERDPTLRTALLAEARAAEGSLDIRALRKELTAMLRATASWYDRRHAREYAHRIEEVNDLLASLLDGGQADAVVELAEHCMKRLDTAFQRIDDSGGYRLAPLERLKEIHHAACVAAELAPRRLGRRLAELALRSDSDLEWFLDAPGRYADVLGDEGLDAFGEALEPAWSALPPRLPSRERTFEHWDGSRWRITHLRESLARARGSVDELVSVLARDLSSAHQFARIADELEAAGRQREALSWLERGNAVHKPAGDPLLQERIVAAYLRDGQVEDAVELAAGGFEHDPSVRRYELLRSAAEAAGDWAQRRPAALERLREANRSGGRTFAVRAQLAEGDLDGAWTDARAGGCDPATWLELADASRERRPDDAAAVYRQAVAAALEHTGTTNYRRAIDLLVRWRAMLEAHARSDELVPEVARIREENRRRPSFLARLDKAGF